TDRSVTEQTGHKKEMRMQIILLQHRKILLPVIQPAAIIGQHDAFTRQSCTMIKSFLLCSSNGFPALFGQPFHLRPERTGR
ncbi:hypothetical protein AF395_24065, partial [Salmonella enterica subsp. enterica serovar Typhimurium]